MIHREFSEELGQEKEDPRYKEVHILGRTFPYQNYDNLKKTVCDFLTTYMKAEVIRDQSYFPVLGGAPGIGKTRTLYEIIKIIQESCNQNLIPKLEGFRVIPLYLTFNSVTLFQPSQKMWGSEGTLVYRSAFEYFLCHRGVAFEVYSEKLKSPCAPGEIRKLLELIKKNEKAEKALFIICLDDFQKTYEQEMLPMNRLRLL